MTIFGDIHRAIGIAVGIGFLLFAAWAMRVNDLRARWQHQYTEEHAGRVADRTAYTAAQTQAAQLNAKQVERAKQQQKDISDATVSHLSARLQLIADELRKQTIAAPQRAPGSAPSGDAVAAPCRAVDPTWLCLSPIDRLRAAQNEERHDELIDLVTAQSKLDPNKP